MLMTRIQIAKLLGVSEPTISTWRKNLGLPYERVGKSLKYPPAPCVAWLVDYRLAEQIGDGHAAAMGAARLKKLTEEGLKLELANAAQRGELIPIALVAEVYEGYCKQVRAGVLSIPAALGRSCPELSASGMDTVRRTIAKVMNGLTDRYPHQETQGEEIT